MVTRLTRLGMRFWRFWLPLAAIFAGIALVEFSLWLLAPADPNREFFQAFFAGGFFQQDPKLGYKANPGRVSTFRKVALTGEEVYHARYTIDPWGRRLTPRLATSTPEQFALFLGCSMVFGEGVNDDQTLPCWFSRLMPEYRSYNLGFPGYGTQHVLELLRTPEMPGGVGEKRGLIVYPFINDHIDRVIGTMRVVEYWGREFPCYEFGPSRTLQTRGSFSQARPWRTLAYDCLFYSNLVHWLNMPFPPDFSDEDLDLVTALIAACDGEVKRRFPDSRFLVLIYPRTSGHGLRVRDALREKNLEVIDFSGLDFPGSLFFLDHHPRPEAQEKLARALSEYVRTHPR